MENRHDLFLLRTWYLEGNYREPYSSHADLIIVEATQGSIYDKIDCNWRSNFKLFLSLISNSLLNE